MSHSSKDYSLTVARWVLGASALLHGIANTFNVWGGSGLRSTTADMAQQASVSGDWVFYAVSIGLMVVGLALLLGTMTRAASLLALLVLVWHGAVTGRFGAYFAQKNGCEDLIGLAALCLVVATHGPGAFKVDFKKASKK